MEDFYMNNTSRNISDHHINATYENNGSVGSTDDALYLFIDAVEWLIVCTGLPLILTGIVAVYCLVRTL